MWVEVEEVAGSGIVKFLLEANPFDSEWCLASPKDFVSDGVENLAPPCLSGTMEAKACLDEMENGKMRMIMDFSSM